jgi:transposase InsO family protein
LATVVVKRIGEGLRCAVKPTAGLVPGLVSDLTRSRRDLLAENALLRQQLIVLRRSARRPKIRGHDRGVMVMLAALTRAWRDAVLLVKPETILRWHRAGFRLFWRRKSRTTRTSRQLASTTIALIKRVALDNRLWGAERVRGELLKLGIRVSKRTVQKYMRLARGPQPWGQSWATFLRNHASQIWACDFLQTYDIFFRPIFAFFMVENGSRRVVHVAVARSPTSLWTGQQLREATPCGSGPRFMLRANDDKYWPEFDRVAKASDIRVLRTPVRAPRANSICERYLGSVRRECLDHIIILSERHLLATLRAYVRYFNTGRPHQGLAQRIPCPPSEAPEHCDGARIVAVPILGGLHHEYRWAA